MGGREGGLSCVMVVGWWGEVDGGLEMRGGWKGMGGREGKGRYLAGFVLCDFVLGVFFAFFAFAVGAAGFGNLGCGFRRQYCLLEGWMEVGSWEICRGWIVSRLEVWSRADMDAGSTYVDLENAYVSSGTSENR